MFTLSFIFIELVKKKAHRKYYVKIVGHRISSRPTTLQDFLADKRGIYIIGSRRIRIGKGSK